MSNLEYQWHDCVKNCNIKKVLYIFFSIFLAYRVVEMMKTLIALDGTNMSWYISLIYGVLLSVFCTGIFAFPGFVLSTSRLLPASYYTIHNKSALDKVYKYLGVDTFRKVIVKLFWGKQKNKKKFFNGKRSGMDQLIHMTNQSEFGHFGALLLLLVVSIIVLNHGYTLIFTVITIINIVGNMYPIVLQRKHRARIAGLRTRQ